MIFEQAIDGLKHFADKADVTGEMRISISFSTPKDKAYFINELQREFEPLNRHDLLNVTEMKIRGVHIRIV